MSIQPDARIERLPSVLARTGLARSSLYAAIARGTFCQPVKLSKRTVGFISAEVDAWIRERAEERRTLSDGSRP
jgi:prophage regulatory protein